MLWQPSGERWPSGSCGAACRSQRAVTGGRSRRAILADVDEIEALVGAWMSVPQMGERLGIPQRTARKMVTDGQVLAHRVGPNAAIGIPAVFVQDGQLLPALPGTVTVLRDAGLTDEEALVWLFTPDETLPITGSPMDMLLAGRKAEVRKRAQELAF